MHNLFCGPVFALHSELCCLGVGLGVWPKKRRERDSVKAYYAVILNLEIMTYVPVRAADPVGAKSRRTKVSVVKIMG